MSKEITKVGQAYLAKGGMTETASKGLITVGAGGLAIGAVAWMLPFISLPMLLVAAVVAGVFLSTK